MTTHARFLTPLSRLAATWLLLAAATVPAQTPVDEDGNPVGTTVMAGDAAAPSGETFTAAELETLVGPIALYPDDLLAIVLPASTYPLEIVQAARFLERLEEDSSLQPDEAWADSVVALLNYPEVVQMMNDDLDWTWRLGEAVVAQQADVVAAVEAFRDRAYAAGNLESDERQTVTRTDEVIEIAPVEEDVIYVPYYEPERVVVRQTRPVYYYYPTPYPVYYYPYPAGHHFADSWFWGVTTAFRIGWLSNHLHVHHHSFHGHPYFGWNYYGSYWRRPSISVFNTYYGTNYRSAQYRYRHGSYWRPRHRGGARPGHYRERDRYYTERRRSVTDDGYANPRQAGRSSGAARAERRNSGNRVARRDGTHNGAGRSDARGGDKRIEFRDRPNATPGAVARRAAARKRNETDIRFRARPGATRDDNPRRRETIRTDRARVADDAARREAMAKGRRLTTPDTNRSRSPRGADRPRAVTRSSNQASARSSNRRPPAATRQRTTIKRSAPRVTAPNRPARPVPQRRSSAATPGRSAPASRSTRPSSPAPRRPAKAPRRSKAPAAAPERRSSSPRRRNRERN